MGDFSKIIIAIAFIALAYFMFRGLKNNPELLSKENLNKSFYTMGLLALGLIGAVAFMVISLK